MRRVAIAAISVFVLAASAWAGGAARSVFDAAEMAPRDVRALIVVDDGASIRRSPAASVVVELVLGAGAFSRTSEAWDRLAEALDMTPAAAFDRLLGERFMLAARPDADGVSHWALLSEITEDDARLLADRVDPAARAVIGGRPALAVEGGEIRMLVAKADRGRKFLLIGPEVGDGLFREMGESLGRRPASPLSEDPDFAELRGLGRDGDILVFSRSADRPREWMAIAGESEGRDLSLRFLLGVPGLREHSDEIRPWSQDVFGALAPGALAVVMDLNEAPGDRDKGGGGLLDGSMLPFQVPKEMRDLLGPRFALVIRPADGLAGGPVEVAVSLETLDTTEMAAAGDAMIGGVLRQVASTEDARRRVPDFSGMPPTGIRTVDLGKVVGPMDGLGWERGPRLSWRSRVAADCNPGQHRGWWTVGLGGLAEELSVRLEQGQDDAMTLPWVSLGVVRPAELVARLEGAGFPVPPAAGPLRGLEEVSWQASRVGSGMVMGLGRIRAIAPAGPGR